MNEKINLRRMTINRPLVPLGYTMAAQGLPL